VSLPQAVEVGVGYRLPPGVEAEDRLPQAVEVGVGYRPLPGVEAEDRLPQAVEAEDRLPQAVEAEDRPPPGRPIPSKALGLLPGACLMDCSSPRPTFPANRRSARVIPCPPSRSR
jgi:hypothetical protein